MLEQHSFQEVMRQYDRMCNSYTDCCDCPFDNDTMTCSTFMSTEPEEFEAIIMEWAEEHPQPRYPTWFEWLGHIGIAGSIKEEDSYGYSNEGKLYFNKPAFTPKAFEPIPDDIAKKLDINPKE